MRIVSLLPSATEIVGALGFGDNLVGRSHECDYPEYVRALPVCTAATLDTRATGSDMDAQVRERFSAGLALYQVLEGTLKQLAPDEVITQSQCRVCAVAPKDLETAMGHWLENRVQVVSLEPNNLQDVWNDIRSVGAALDAPERGEEAAEPDVILVQPCGFDLARTRQEMTPLTKHASWAHLRAVRHGRVVLADGNHYFNRPGPRLAGTAEILAETLHPEAFRFGYEGSAWVYL